MGIISSFKNLMSLRKEGKCIRILGQIRFWVERHEKAIKNGKDEALVLGLTTLHITELLDQLDELDCLDSDRRDHLRILLDEWLLGKRQYSKQGWKEFEEALGKPSRPTK